MKTKIVAVTIVFLLGCLNSGWAQCAMCRSTLENNYSNGHPGIAAGINMGILYLLVLPYAAVMILGYLWYKSSKDARNKLSGGTAAG
ncbi:MAG TPA: hypothetical protein VIN08_06140 [Ohtaekwangia sp.]|uniref:hypothetical protein n=1 Tax=Ohtaekwangia sp. TaxID=2066019 RepID=UPI002F92095A